MSRAAFPRAAPSALRQSARRAEPSAALLTGYVIKGSRPSVGAAGLCPPPFGRLPPGPRLAAMPPLRPPPRVSTCRPRPPTAVPDATRNLSRWVGRRVPPGFASAPRAGCAPHDRRRSPPALSTCRARPPTASGHDTRNLCASGLRLRSWGPPAPCGAPGGACGGGYAPHPAPSATLRGGVAPPGRGG